MERLRSDGGADRRYVDRPRDPTWVRRSNRAQYNLTHTQVRARERYKYPRLRACASVRRVRARYLSPADREAAAPAGHSGSSTPLAQATQKRAIAPRMPYRPPPVKHKAPCPCDHAGPARRARGARSPRGRARTEWEEPPRTRAVYVRNSSGEREDDAMARPGEGVPRWLSAAPETYASFTYALAPASYPPRRCPCPWRERGRAPPTPAVPSQPRTAVGRNYARARATGELCGALLIVQSVRSVHERRRAGLSTRALDLMTGEAL